MITGTRSFFALILLTALLAGSAFAHPEDEFCQGMEGMDPALCKALAEIDSDTAAQATSELAGRSGADVFSLYVGNGVGHILPGGLDHILFVLALFLAAASLRSLIWQISAFTLAHTVTLGLAATGQISVPASAVEPLIAFSIAVMALANLFPRDEERWRLALIFGFGLLHGLGFAGFLLEQGLPDGQVWPALIGFNIGVELGQLSVIFAAALLAFMLRRTLLAEDAAYRKVVVVPLSLVIALVGFVWTVQRVI